MAEGFPEDGLHDPVGGLRPEARKGLGDLAGEGHQELLGRPEWDLILGSATPPGEPRSREVLPSGEGLEEGGRGQLQGLGIPSHPSPKLGVRHHRSHHSIAAEVALERGQIPHLFAVLEVAADIRGSPCGRHGLLRGVSREEDHSSR